MRANMIILTCLYLLPVILGNNEKNETKFVPTREWQSINKGTPIPAGSHVRHNFRTGVTEVKLMDNKDAEKKSSNESSSHSISNSLTLHPDMAVTEDHDSSIATEKSDLFDSPIEELKARLKKIKQGDTKTPPKLNDEHVQQIKQKFRDYDTLKNELKMLDVNITLDSELLSNYLQKFQTHSNAITMGTLTVLEVEEVLNILYNLEYLVHHIDHAKVFTDMQGMSKVISPCLNATNNEIKAEALRLLGAAVQSNPNVQLKALENDFVEKLLHILSTSTKLEVKSKCLFALGALIRQFPAAQKVWIDHGGVEIFGKILTDDQLQVQVRVMQLISDLITERQNLREITDPEQLQLKTKAYAAADVEQKLLTYGYCKHLSNLMIKSFKVELNNQFKTENYNFLETITESMIIVVPVCNHHFKKNKETLLLIIQHLLNFYQSSDPAIKEDESDILKNLTLLIEKLQTTVTEILRDEL
ncbi:nucleotide exchange factor Sil1 [Hylaeus anthracinus]|uniref:nucleotide exchange factor Sil1 n=1 Tax=Hylaeus anthracinus TaxID=313031 RepID=UPI0023B9292E|nr:nucleotide exchange factor Sil1 [Hylaeus anthracinus]